MQTVYKSRASKDFGFGNKTKGFVIGGSRIRGDYLTADDIANLKGVKK